MSELVLAVDDEPLVLSGYRRNLGDRYGLVTAQGPELALSMIKSESFAVVLSDLKMPGMDGIELLRQIREVSPSTVRLMISGHADLGDAINSVNRAGIFRLLIKPSPLEELSQAIDSALEQYRLVTAEKALLEGTLNGAVEALIEIMGELDSEAFSQAQVRRKLAKAMALHLRAPVWEFEMAAQLSEIGRATLPTALNEKIKADHRLSESEARLVSRVPEFSARLIAHIPRLEGVAKAVAYQNKDYNGRGYPEDGIAGSELPLAARTLHVINAYLAMRRRGSTLEESIATLRMGPERFDPAVVHALLACAERVPLKGPVGAETAAGPRQVRISELSADMVLVSDIITLEGVVLLGAGTKLSGAQAQRVKNFAQLNPVKEPILVDHAVPVAH